MQLTFLLFFSFAFLFIHKTVKKHKLSIFVLFFLITQYILINCNPIRDLYQNKMSILDNIPDEYKPTSEFYDKNKVYSYPFILKPVLCSGISREVSIIKNEDDNNSQSI